MKAKIHNIYSSDIDDLVNYIPSNPEIFNFHLSLIAGPDSEDGEESFDLQVCSPKWMIENYKREEVIIGRHHLIMMEYSYERMITSIENFLMSCEGNNWHEVASKLSRLGYWEFEDYIE